MDYGIENGPRGATGPAMFSQATGRMTPWDFVLGLVTE
jgi:hypothetical protein